MDGAHFLILTISGKKKDGRFFNESCKAAGVYPRNLSDRLAKKVEDKLKSIFSGAYDILKMF